MSKGDYRKYYKGHMDQIKGDGGGGGGRWVQLGWGGGREEKAYNCNRITIKINFKKEEAEILNRLKTTS